MHNYLLDTVFAFRYKALTNYVSPMGRRITIRPPNKLGRLFLFFLEQIMRYPRGVPSHGRIGCCPDDWDGIPDITGSYELDAVIKQSKNKDVPERLQMYCQRVNSYGPITAYDGYNGYSGDN